MKHPRLLNLKNVKIPNELVKNSNKIKPKIVIVKLTKAEILKFQIEKSYLKIHLYTFIRNICQEI